jgi:hypothetical protein
VNLTRRLALDYDVRLFVNRACHDNTPAGAEEMKQACGEIRRFVEDYLGR